MKTVEILSGVEAGFVVRIVEPRSGGSKDQYASDKPPVGISGIDEATFFSLADPPDCNNERAYQQASRLAYWQTGEVVRAIRVNGVIRAID